ncbi:MAG: VCBS repeat-containing protein [Myxococcales bacterium]|nr:VCBS repeat-containing protein [Myxococcales bacterium]
MEQQADPHVNQEGRASSPRPFALLPALAVLAAVAACGDDGAGETDASVTTVADTASGTTSGPGTSDPSAPGTSDPGGSDSETGSTGEPDTSGSDATTDDPTDATTGEPLACEFAPGCHQPTAPADGVGLASHVPVGCDSGGGFTKRWSVFVQAGGYASAEAPRAIPYLGDFNDDGALDLFVNFRKAGAAYVFTGTGDGAFDPTPATLTGGLFSGGWGGDLGDLNGDGKLDILVGDHVRGAWAWAGDGAFGFSDLTAGLPDPFLFNGGGLADLDGDGDLDGVFGADQFNKGYALAHNDGAGSWTVGAAPSSAQAGSVGSFSFHDYDGDGDLDIFAFGHGGGTIMDAYVYRNDGGGFAEVLAAAIPGQSVGTADPVQGSIGDVNCDGAIDILAGGTVLLASGGSWSIATSVDGAQIGHLADMNGDGHLDVITHDASVGLALYLGDGTGTGWTAQAGLGLPDAAYQAGGAMGRAYGIDVGDVDNSDNMDIVRLAEFGADFVLEVWSR